MSGGVCVRCGQQVDRIEADHPDGSVRGGSGRRKATAVYPDATVPLCRQCHVDKGVIDRAAGVEGAGCVSVWLLVRRRSAWAGFLALPEQPVTLQSKHLSDLARVLRDVAKTVSVCSAVLAGVAVELRRHGLDDLATKVEQVASMLGRSPYDR